MQIFMLFAPIASRSKNETLQIFFLHFYGSGAVQIAKRRQKWRTFLIQIFDISHRLLQLRRAQLSILYKDLHVWTSNLSRKYSFINLGAAGNIMERYALRSGMQYFPSATFCNLTFRVDLGFFEVFFGLSQLHVYGALVLLSVFGSQMQHSSIKPLCGHQRRIRP